MLLHVGLGGRVFLRFETAPRRTLHSCGSAPCSSWCTYLTSPLCQPFPTAIPHAPASLPRQPPTDPAKRARWSALQAAAGRARAMLGLGEGQAAALAELFGGNGRPSLVPEGLGITPSISGLCRWGLGGGEFRTVA